MKTKSTKIIKSSVSKVQTPEVMKPLNDFMAQNSINTRMLADKMGLTRQNILYMLKNDTTKLSMLEKIAEAMDSRLCLSLRRGGNVYDNTYPWTPPACGPKDLVPVRISFLNEAMAKNSLDIPKVANALGLKGGTIRHWFHVDDVQLNNVQNFADAFGFEFKMSFKPISEVYNDKVLELLRYLRAYKNPCIRPLIEAILDIWEIPDFLKNK